MWRSVHIQSYSVGHIDCIVHFGTSKWRFTGFHGNPVADQHHHSWDLLKRLADIPELRLLPWLVEGDFNEILFESEKLGGQSRNLSQMTDFSEALDESGLQDISFKGDHLTWCNKRRGDDMILARLDRFVCNFDWHMAFPSAEVENLAYFGSDHSPISVVLKSIFLPKIMKYPKKIYL